MKKRLLLLILYISAFYTMWGNEVPSSDYSELNKLTLSELHQQAELFMRNNQIEEALRYYIVLAGKYHSELSLKEKYWCSEAYNHVGEVYFQKENHFNAFDLFLKGLQISEKNDFKDLTTEIYKNIGNVYSVFQDVDRGIEYYKKALDMAREQGQITLEPKILNNLISTCCYKQLIDDARQYHRQNLKYVDQDSLQRYYYYRNMAMINLGEGKLDSALVCYKNSATYARKAGLDGRFLSNSYTQLAHLYWATDNIDSSLHYFHLNIDDFAGKHINTLTENLLLLSKIYNQIDDPEKSRRYRNLYLELSDSVFVIYRTNLKDNAQFVYEMDRNRHEIEILNLDKERKEIKIAEQRTAMKYILVCLMIFVIMLVVVWIQKRKLNETYKELYIRNREIIKNDMLYKKERQEYLRKSEEGLVRLTCYESLTTKFTPVELKSNIDQNNESDLSSKSSYASSKLTENQKEELLKAISNLMENSDEYCDSNFGVDRIVELVGSNSRYISQAINETYNKNLRTYINEYRIREAQIRLMNTEVYGNYTIKAIAESVGYKSQANFIEIFKKTTGMTPSVYQKMAKEKME